MEYEAKLNAKYMPVLHYSSSFEDSSYKKLHDRTSLFVSCYFNLALLDFMVFLDSPKPLHPLNSQVRPSATKVFC